MQKLMIMTSCLLLAISMAGCQSTMKVTVERIDYKSDEIRTTRWDDAERVQVCIKALYDYYEAFTEIKEEYSDRIRLDVREGITAYIEKGKEASRSGDAEEQRNYVHDVRNFLREQRIAWTQYADMYKIGDPIRKTAERISLVELPQSLDQIDDTLRFGGYACATVHSISSENPKYQEILKAPIIEQPFSEVYNWAVGDSCYLVVQESPTNIHFRRATVDSDTIAKNAFFLQDKIMQAWIKYMTGGLPTAAE